MLNGAILIEKNYKEGLLEGEQYLYRYTPSKVLEYKAFYSDNIRIESYINANRRIDEIVIMSKFDYFPYSIARKIPELKSEITCDIVV